MQPGAGEQSHCQEGREQGDGDVKAPLTEVVASAVAEIEVGEVLETKKADDDGGVELESLSDLSNKADFPNDQGNSGDGKKTRVQSRQAPDAVGVFRFGSDRVESQMSDCVGIRYPGCGEGNGRFCLRKAQMNDCGLVALVDQRRNRFMLKTFLFL